MALGWSRRSLEPLQELVEAELSNGSKVIGASPRVRKKTLDGEKY
jgi:hypothetical protein